MSIENYGRAIWCRDGVDAGAIDTARQLVAIGGMSAQCVAQSCFAFWTYLRCNFLSCFETRGSIVAVDSEDVSKRAVQFEDSHESRATLLSSSSWQEKLQPSKRVKAPSRVVPEDFPRHLTCTLICECGLRRPCLTNKCT